MSPDSSNAMGNMRTEKDSMGEIQVPASALYGAQTQRAVDNFRISGITMPAHFICALGLIKAAAARANADLGLLEAAISAEHCRCRHRDSTGTVSRSVSR